MRSNILLKRDYEWGFFQVESVELGSESYMHGFLVKSKPKTKDEVIVKETHQIDTEERLNSVAAMSRFFLHIPSGLIAYRPIHQHINDSHFRQTFKMLFEDAHGNFFTSVDIQTVDERDELLSIIKSFTSITRVSITLHPTNPGFDPIYEAFDERLRHRGVETHQESYTAKNLEVGLNLSNDEDFISKITMANDGYGEARVKGKMEGKEVIVSTKDHPIGVAVPVAEDESPQVLKYLIETFGKIRRRIQQVKLIDNETITLGSLGNGESNVVNSEVEDASKIKDVNQR